jgi:hypothetical protein
MSAEGPAVVQRHDGRHLPAEPRQRPQVELPAVQVMTVDEIRARGWQIEEPVCTGKPEILSADVPSHKRVWMRRESKRAAERSEARTRKPARHGPQSSLEGQIARRAADRALVVRDLEDCRIGAATLPHGRQASQPAR